ncbi:hypothetical protein A3B45_01005 [Candidatus Daviesbacteria bacterium RIFCSPLOWO2_01_FULL_39_12]|uniref:Translation elongation factor-like protein n=1 Tax=Candidatus Daviesbacteria bacterium RIFCSPLOWO2_01_FULL_39_12 TaxID=1797785 RepID=A0A1F5KTA8_9BACT|nr:MAG: hypothetical protein A3D79_02060 [Candidatus Daviesbacteria bacterium RIFCSPHIGHO2_02_FULL_39_8]OGE44163.1 MAG: hypothetical protein A3B45_01005 [Candidatus Daviesbacteria bacterium RIFCSPLOWO2_01_FULL_39_12]
MDKAIGKVVHYYDKLGVAIIDLEKGGLKVGDELKFKRGEDEFSQKIESLQVDHKDVDSVKKGDSFGVKVDKPTKVGTQVFLT